MRRNFLYVIISGLFVLICHQGFLFLGFMHFVLQIYKEKSYNHQNNEYFCTIIHFSHDKYE